MRYAAERRNLNEAIEDLRQIADGRNDVLAEATGITAGSWYANPATDVGYELIGAGMLILAGGGRGLPLDYDELARWTRVGYERGMRSRRVSDDRRELLIVPAQQGMTKPLMIPGALSWWCSALPRQTFTITPSEAPHTPALSNRWSAWFSWERRTGRWSLACCLG
jgi:hypothetical protein